jgi:glucosamine-6-phosphate deaminase
LRVKVFPTADRAARALAVEVARLIATKPTAVLALPTGRTPIPLYRELVRLHGMGRASFARVSTFNVDEFVGIPAADPRSYHAFMRHHFFSHVDLPLTHAHFLNGMAHDLDRECARYERAIERAGGIDLQILGLGANGHIGFNEPGPSLAARTHRTRLRGMTRRANAVLFGNRWRAVPREALSMGMATILQARRIVLIATGKEKARCVVRMIHGPLTPRLPASFLQLHRRAEVWLDRDAANRL